MASRAQLQAPSDEKSVNRRLAASGFASRRRRRINGMVPA
jgi:hypothetical protein